MFKKFATLTLAILIIFPAILPISGTAFAAAGSREEVARITNVEYKLQDNVEWLPEGVDYRFEPIQIDWEKYRYLEDVFSGQTPSSLPTTPPSTGEQGLLLSPQTLEGSEKPNLPFNAKKLIIDTDKVFFTPEVGKVYVDPVRETAFRVLDRSTTEGVYHVVAPDFEEVFRRFRIPKQTIALEHGNLSYLAPGVTHAPSAAATAMTASTITSQGCSTLSGEDVWATFQIVNLELHGRFGGQEAEDEQEGHKLHGISKGTSGEATITVNGYIKLSRPKVTPEIDIGLVTQEARIEIDMIAEGNFSLDGDVQVQSVIPTLIAGYEVPVEVNGREIGHLRIGVYLVLGLDGRLSVEVKVQTNGELSTGLVAKAVATVPYYVGPFGDYENKCFDFGLVADGRLKAFAAAVPQLGLSVLNYDIAALQLWLGLDANLAVYFETRLKNGRHVTVNEGSVSAGFFTNLDAYAFDEKYVIFEFRKDLVSRRWGPTEGDKVSVNGSTDPRYEIKITEADAVENRVSGVILKNQVREGGIRLRIKAEVGPETQYSIGQRPAELEGITQTNERGEFQFRFPTGSDLTTRHIVSVTVLDADSKPVAETTGITPMMPTIEVSADAFNNKVSGTVSGGYSGNINIEIYSDARIPKTEDTQAPKLEPGLDLENTTGTEGILPPLAGIEDLEELKGIGDRLSLRPIHHVTAHNGNFELSVPLTKGDQVRAVLSSGGDAVKSELVDANLDSLRINFKIRNNGIYGTIENRGATPSIYHKLLPGEDVGSGVPNGPYVGTVVLKYGKIPGFPTEIIRTKAQVIDFASAATGSKETKPEDETSSVLGSLSELFDSENTSKSSEFFAKDSSSDAEALTTSESLTLSPPLFEVLPQLLRKPVASVFQFEGTVPDEPLGFYTVSIESEGIVKEQLLFFKPPIDLRSAQLNIPSDIEQLRFPLEGTVEKLFPIDRISDPIIFQPGPVTPTPPALPNNVLDETLVKPDITVRIGGVLKSFRQPPVITGGTTLVPLRGIFESLGAQVEWDPATKTVKASKGGTTITLRIGEKQAAKNGVVVPLAQPAQILNGSTMVPLRFVSEALGSTVKWDGATKSIDILGPDLEKNLPPLNTDGKKLFPLLNNGD